MEKRFIMAIQSIRGTMLLGSFDTGEEAVRARETFKEKHSIASIEGIEEPVMCVPCMFVVQSGKDYIYGQPPHMAYDTFIVNSETIPSWNLDIPSLHF